MSRTLHHGLKAKIRRFGFGYRPTGWYDIGGEEFPAPPKRPRRGPRAVSIKGGGNFHYRLHLPEATARALSREFCTKILKAVDLDDLPLFPELRKPMD